VISIPFYDKANLKGIIKRFKINPDPKHSQNFVINRVVCQKMVEFVPISSENSLIVEIGPGFGAFTEFILKKAHNLILIEKDARFVQFLQDYYHDKIIGYDLNSIISNPSKIGGIILLHNNILEVQLPPKVYYISNLPFQISYEFIRYLAIHNDFESATLILQQEFIDHLISTPNHSHYSAISVIFQSFLKCDIKMELEKDDFYPNPDVNTAIVQIIPQREFELSFNKIGLYVAWLEKLFQFKNKSLLNAFKALGWNTEILDGEILKNKASNLSANQLMSIFTYLYPND
jgi:16S rRNA (adenine1518-N6/adenine1519-N6)-dimethyltransferase